MSVFDAILGQRKAEHRAEVARRYALDVWLRSVPEPETSVLAAPAPKPEVAK